MSVVKKTLDIIEAVLKTGDEISLADLAKITGVNRTTVHRISAILVERGYLYQKKRGDKYSLGLKFLQYSRQSSAVVGIRDTVLPFLQNLCDETSETVNVAMLNGIEAFTVASIGAEDRVLLVAPNPSNKFPLHCTAMGKILLVSMENKKIKNIIDIIGLNAYTDNTITDADQLIKEIEKIRRNGVAYDDEEYWIGIRSTAAPIMGEGGDVIAGMSVVGPSVRISKSKMIQLAPVVKNCALKISQSLGYTGKRI